MDEQLRRRIEQIESRLDRLEKHRPSQAGARDAQDPVIASPVTPPPLPTPTRKAVAPVKASPQAPVPLAYQPAISDHETPTIEQTIGLKWAGWIGAIVLVIGAALGFKYAYDQGWLQMLPENLKLAALSLVGFGLIGIGEWVLRRVNKTAAVGFYGAGVAMLFVASYAGHAWYGLFAHHVAIGLSLASAFTGVMLAARADLVSVAVLAIVGGALAPIVIRSPDPSLIGFMIYLSGLQFIAVALCWWQAKGKWWVLRSLVWTILVIWMSGAIFSFMHDPYHALTVFAILFAVLAQGELILTTHRAHAFGRSSMAPAAGVIFSLLVTSGFIMWILMIERDSTHLVRGAWVLGTAAACATVGFVLRGRDTVFLPISQSLRVQAVMLIVLAVPVLMDGSNIIWGWVLLGVGLALIGHWAKLPISLVGAACVWALAVAAWSGWQLTPMGRSDWFVVISTPIEARVVMGIVLTLSGHLIAQVLSTRLLAFSLAVRERLDQIGAIQQVAAASTLVVTALMLPAVAGTMLLIGYVWVCMISSMAPRMRLLKYVALGALVATAVKWVGVDIAQPRAMGLLSAAPYIANWRFVCGCLIAATFLVQTMASRGDARTAMTLATSIFAVLVGTLEIDRFAQHQSNGPEWIVRQVGWSIFWACGAAIMIVIGFLINDRVLRVFALFLLGTTLVKITLVDLSGVGTGWRILSFIGLGGVLLATSVLYGKFGSTRTRA